MTLLDFLPCFEALAIAAILPIAAVLLWLYINRRKQDRLAKWQAIGLTPQKWTWQALTAWNALAGKHRGRSLTMCFYAPDESDLFGERFTRIRVAVRSPSATRLTIRPKWPSRGLARFFAPQTHGIEDTFSIQSDPPDLALRALAIPRITAILLSDPAPAIELKGNQLQFERPGDFPYTKDAVDLFDMLCDLAELIEQAPGEPFKDIDYKRF